MVPHEVLVMLLLLPDLVTRPETVAEVGLVSLALQVGMGLTGSAPAREVQVAAVADLTRA